MLYNQTLRCCWLGELYARIKGLAVDSEQLFLSAVFHDLGLTDYARGPNRFEIESANAARTFLIERGQPKAVAQNVWDDIALHTWDMNMFRGEPGSPVRHRI